MVAHDVCDEICLVVKVVFVTEEALEELANAVIRGEVSAHVYRRLLTARLQTLLPASRSVLGWVEIALGNVIFDASIYCCSI